MTELLLLGGHALLASTLSIYGLHRLWLTARYWRTRRQAPALTALEEETLPVVTVQLPVYNERYVVTRLIDAAAALDWPRDRLELQILDDSDDDTTPLAEAAAARHRAKGLDVTVLRRPDRQGFKAGALAWGLSRAKGSIIAIFDADFVPPADFLRRAVPDLTRPLDTVAVLATLRRALGEQAPPEVTVVVGLGLHRPLTEAELAPMRAACGWPVVNSNPDDTADLGLVHGVPCQVAHPIAEAEMTFAIGVVELHQYAGFSGGHKASAVGCGGRDTLAALHAREMVCDPEVQLGRVEGNPFREAVDALGCLLYTSPSPRDRTRSRMPSSA